jgi:2-polyprenyl-3-methyl-5-hydroxy-6-metoxy-1,4-benzoquinol methylase
MPIDFHDKKNQFTYSNRSVDPIWSQMIRTIINPKGKLVLDIGCGGGIYSRVWAELGATKVIGIDFSE